MSECTIAEIITAATPILTALIGALVAYFPAYAKGRATPRREELEIRAELEALKNGKGKAKHRGDAGYIGDNWLTAILIAIVAAACAAAYWHFRMVAGHP